MLARTHARPNFWVVCNFCHELTAVEWWMRVRVPVRAYREQVT